MLKINAGIIMVLFLGSLFLLGESRAAGKYDEGKNLYNKKCQICHGIKGDGKGPGAIAFSPKPTDFTKSEFWANNPDKKIATSVKDGYGAMSPISLKPDEISAVIEYMAKTFKKVNKN